MRLGLAALGVSAWVLFTGPEPAARTGAACPPVPEPPAMSNPAYYSFVNSYDPTCSSRRNWDRRFDDVTISSVTRSGRSVSLTASTALAGAIASVQLDGRELIASGGHGAALQWAFHAWREGSIATECYNPTQAGSRPDDAGPPPYHGPSTSALYELRKPSPRLFETTVRPAMYVPLSMSEPGFGGCRSVDYQPNRSPFTFGLSPYWLNTETSFPESGPPGVARERALLTSEDELYANFDAVFIAYTQRDLSSAFAFDPKRDSLRALNPAGEASTDPILRCTPGRRHCLSLYFERSMLPRGYYYARSESPSPYNGMAGAYTAQVTVPANGIGAGAATRLPYAVDVVVGNATEVKAALRQLSYRRLTGSEGAR